jgi:hypothetical protein
VAIDRTTARTTKNGSLERLVIARRPDRAVRQTSAICLFGPVRCYEAPTSPCWFTMTPTRYLPDAKLDALHRHLLHRKAPVLYHRTAVGAAIPLAEQEGEEHVPPPARHGQCLVQVADARNAR